MSAKDRRDTDAIAKPIDVAKITPRVKPWTREEARKAKLAHKAKAATKRKD